MSVTHLSRLRRVFAAFPTGVTALAAEPEGIPVGMAASSFTSVSLEPPLVSVCVAQTSRTWPALRAASRIGVSVLADGHAEASRRLSAKDGDRFGGQRWRRSDDRALPSILLRVRSARVADVLYRFRGLACCSCGFGFMQQSEEAGHVCFLAPSTKRIC